MTKLNNTSSTVTFKKKRDCSCKLNAACYSSTGSHLSNGRLNRHNIVVWLLNVLARTSSRNVRLQNVMCFVLFEIQKSPPPSFRINTYECYYFLGQDNFVYILLVSSFRRQRLYLFYMEVRTFLNNTIKMRDMGGVWC